MVTIVLILEALLTLEQAGLRKSLSPHSGCATNKGPDRDSDRWDKFPKEAERRRRLWWEMITFECIQCYGMGLPRAVSVSSVNYCGPSFNSSALIPDNVMSKCPMTRKTTVVQQDVRNVTNNNRCLLTLRSR